MPNTSNPNFSSFTHLEENVLVNLDPTAPAVGVDTEILFGADIIVAFDDNEGVDADTDGTVSVAPIEVKVSTNDTVPIKVILGAVQFDAGSAVIDMHADITIEECPSSSCVDYGFPIPDGSILYFNVTSSAYTIGGDISLDGNYGGFSIDSGSTVSISQDGLFENPDPDVTFNGFDIEEASVERFSLVNALGMLRIIDTAFVRTQENPKYTLKNFPFTKTVLASNVVTGSFVTTRLWKLFAKPKDFDLRASKSLRVTASEAIGNATSEAKDLELLIVKDELVANPEDTEGVRGLSNTTSCPFTFDTNVTSGDEFADLLVGGITNASCGVTACRFNESTCTEDSDTSDISGCGTCDVIIDTDTATGLLYIASVAYSSSGSANDVVLLGLYEANKTGGPETFFGFPLNQPENADPVPRFNSIVEFKDKIQVAASEAFQNVMVALSYISTSNATDNKARWEVDIEFERTKTEPGVLWDATEGIGDFENVLLEANSTFDLVTSARYSGKLAAILSPNDSDLISLQVNACNSTGFNCSLESLQFEIEFTRSGTNENLTITIPAEDSTRDADEVLNEVFVNQSLGIVERLSSTVLDISFDEAISEVIIRVPKDCKDLTLTTNITRNDLLTCEDSEEPEILFNSYGLKDTVLAKPQFEIAVGQMIIDANYTATGDATITSALNGILEVSADLNGTINGTSTLDLGAVGDLHVASDWIIKATVLNETFFVATTDFDMELDAKVSALPPFESKAQGVLGVATLSGFAIDFTTNGADYPNVTLAIDVIGDVRQLEFGTWALFPHGMIQNWR